MSKAQEMHDLASNLANEKLTSIQDTQEFVRLYELVLNDIKSLARQGKCSYSRRFDDVSGDFMLALRKKLEKEDFFVNLSVDLKSLFVNW